jgi:hypothetical protein
MGVMMATGAKREKRVKRVEGKSSQVGLVAASGGWRDWVEKALTLVTRV